MATFTKNQSIKAKAWINANASKSDSTRHLVEWFVAVHPDQIDHLDDENSPVWEWAANAFVETHSVSLPATLETTVEPVVSGETATATLETTVEPVVSGETATATLETAPTTVEVICSGCDDLNVDELKEVIEYCSSRIDELQKEQVEALESEMRAIQDKLMALKGFRGKPVAVAVEKTEGAKRTVTPLVNPNNPTESYTFGKHPAWLTELCAKTGKTPFELRQMAK